MLALEEALGCRLFTRSARGYGLTDEGRKLLDHVQAMETAMQPLNAWQEGIRKRSQVRISAGSWTAQFCAQNLSRLWRSSDTFMLAFKSTEARLDLAHREAEIGLRNAAPTSANLAARQLGEVAFAPYRARGSGVENQWIAIDPAAASTPSAHWLNRRTEAEVVVYANAPRMLHDLVRTGLGIAILPCFVGDRDADLERCGSLIEELTSKQWITMHNDDRHRSEIRTVIDRLSRLLSDHAPLFRGERPIGG
ncbi:LysR family transcriptional regulator [Nitratireductor basaltis]|uniref:LysR family transcriptional regulator n=2 Tax=Nitratireductor basaltis TaxID=472175 RepID=A0A084UDS7_9HYPH|nr:LysR family transcriptional regulator [Nitratireductor basaltis]